MSIIPLTPQTGIGCKKLSILVLMSCSKLFVLTFKTIANIQNILISLQIFAAKNSKTASSCLYFVMFFSMLILVVLLAYFKWLEFYKHSLCFIGLAKEVYVLLSLYIL